MDKKDYLRSLSSVNDLLQAFTHAQGTSGGIPRTIAVESIRVVVDGVREAIQAARDEAELEEIKTDVDDLLPLVEEEVRERLQSHLRRVVNATGVVLHTNLGRSILPPEALESIRAAAGAYSNLELDLETGERGSRHSHVEQLLCELTGAEAAMAVNNNAGAVLLALTTHARGREVVVSRGQLIEIGGSFRIPEVMEQSGARLVEVGATNRTRISDFRAAVGEETAMLMRAHPSNYRIIGFTEETPLAEMSALAQERGLVLLDDLGSGVLIDLARFGLPPEPTPTQSLKEGADLVTFSGDKLLGGPQAGIVVGRKDLVHAMSRHPLARALRIDKLTLAALEAVLRLYLEPDEVAGRVPTLVMLTLPPEELKRRARKLAKGIGAAADAFEVEVVEDSSQAGGGSLPATLIPTWVASVTSPSLTANQLEERLRASNPPVIVRIHEDRVLLDPRTLAEDEYELILSAFSSIAAGPEE
jgi:L-seryl-tRNA(Ser) seleniumtransferase